jgi:hypothetical protein
VYCQGNGFEQLLGASDGALLQPQTPTLSPKQLESGSLRRQPPAAHAAPKATRQGVQEKGSLTLIKINY